jgi:hypothetical protein
MPHQHERRFLLPALHVLNACPLSSFSAYLDEQDPECWDDCPGLTQICTSSLLCLSRSRYCTIMTRPVPFQLYTSKRDPSCMHQRDIGWDLRWLRACQVIQHYGTDLEDLGLLVEYQTGECWWR